MIVVAATAPYLPSLNGDFALDDVSLIVQNPVAQDVGRIPEAFLTDYLHNCLGADAVYYRPLVAASFAANWSISGPDPLVFRLTNLLLSIAVDLLVFTLALRLTGQLVAAGVAGVAFAVLPSHAESVAWISGRTDLLAMAFGLGSFLAFVEGWRRPGGFGWRMGAACGVLLTLALFSKETALMLPVLMVVYVWVFGPSGSAPHSSSRRERLLTVLKWLAVILPPIILYIMMRRYVLGVALDSGMLFMLKERIARVGVVYCTYLRMLFVPLELRLVYDHYPFGMKPVPVEFVAWMAPIALVLAAVWTRRRAPVLSFGLAWVFVAVLPVSDILPVHGLLPVERFAYPASVGSSIILGWIAWWLYRLKPRRVRMWPILAPILFAGYVLYCGTLAYEGSQIYTSNVAWARRIAATNPRYRIFRASAAKYFADAGLLAESMREYQATLDLSWKGFSRQDRIDMQYTLGLMFVATGDLPRAARAFRKTVEIDPTFGKAWRNLGKASCLLGRYRDAVEAYERAGELVALSEKDRADLARARARVRTR